jgi:hypothetical protein
VPRLPSLKYNAYIPFGEPRSSWRRWRRRARS